MKQERVARDRGVLESENFAVIAPFASRFRFFFHAEDGIRGATVTGVQTCALPISAQGSGMKKRLTSLGLFRLLNWIDGTPLLDHIEPYRRRIFSTVLDDVDPTTGRVKYNLALMEIGRASCRERVAISGRAESLPRL